MPVIATHKSDEHLLETSVSTHIQLRKDEGTLNTKFDFDDCYVLGFVCSSRCFYLSNLSTKSKSDLKNTACGGPKIQDSAGTERKAV